MDNSAARRRRLKVYLAGPDVFLPNAIKIGQRKKKLCADYGFIGLYPFDNEAIGTTETRMDISIYRANTRMMKQADFGIFNLTPFRGPSADAGTIFELGMLIGLGKSVFAYTNDPRVLLEKVRQLWPTRLDDGIWRDSNNWSVENFSNFDNLMIDAALREQGHPIISHAAPSNKLLEDLTSFEACLRLAAREFLSSNELKNNRQYS